MDAPDGYDWILVPLRGAERLIIAEGICVYRIEAPTEFCGEVLRVYVKGARRMADLVIYRHPDGNWELRRSTNA